MSMYNGTLPHWSGPGYYGLIIVAAVYCASVLIKKSPNSFNIYVWGGNILLVVIIVLALLQTYTGAIPLGNNDNPTKTGKNDPTIDLYAWDKVGKELTNSFNSSVEIGAMEKDYVIITHKWFPAGHLDYYFAIPSNKSLFVLGDVKAQHIYKPLYNGFSFLKQCNSATYNYLSTTLLLLY